MPENGIETAICNTSEFIEGINNYGKPRPGHKEGAVIYHVKEVLANIDKFYNDDEDRSDLRLIAILHDTFKYKVDHTKPKVGENHHGMIARRFAEKFPFHQDILTVIELHDDAYNAWQKGGRHGDWYKAKKRASNLINALQIENCLDLYTKFYRCDNATGDKSQENYKWFNDLIQYNKAMFMPVPIPIFLEKFVDNVVNFFKGRTVYERYTLGTTDVTAVQKNLIKKNQNLLTDHGVPINKIRFVFHPTFTYDVDKNVINPVYHAFFPMNGDTGRFAKNEPVIEIGKPDKLIMVIVDNYKFSDNYEQLKMELKSCKRGIVIMINDEMVNDFLTGEPKPYKFSVDDEVIRYANLDTKVAQYPQFAEI